MNRIVFLVLIVPFSMLFAQTPGGVLGEDLWYKTDAETVIQNEYDDYGPNNYEIIKSGAIQAGLFNFNHSLDFGGGNLNFPYSVEDMKVATIFIVYTYPEENNLSLIHSEWQSGYNGNGTNEKRFSYTTQKLDKEDFLLDYPEEEQEISNALVNTLNWFDFNSTHINNDMGTGGESKVFVGKANDGASNFSGSIPEFIFYRKALSKEERQRIESYLAIKYGITLTSGVGYYNSNYDEIWEAGNNEKFGNRVFAIGRDDLSGLYQKQSKSSHPENDELILNAGELEETNDENIAVFEGSHFIFIGDNNGSDTPAEDIDDWELHPLDRVWLVHPYGETANTITTELRYDAAHLFDKIEQDYDQEFWEDITIWILIDRSADEQDESSFDLNQVEAYMYDDVQGDQIVYYGLNWDEDSTGLDQFTFAVGPKMLVDVSLQEMDCEDEEGNIDVHITFGEPDFDFEIYDENDVLVDSQAGYMQQDISFYELPNGWYTIKVTDFTGYEREETFEVSPTAGMYINLEDEYVLLPNETLLLDASENVYIENVTYQWYRNDEPFATIPVVEIEKTGVYRVVLTNENGCQVEDTTIVKDENGDYKTTTGTDEPDDSLAKERIRIYPNPTKVNQEFTVEINLLEKQDVLIQIHDYSGSLIHTENLKDISDYKWTHRLFQSGSYLISVTTKNHSLTKKLIIQ